MGTYSRSPLEQNAVIRLASDSTQPVFTRDFHIRGPLGEGASAVCYEAYHRGSGTGVLKEFYPRNMRGERETNGTLRFPAAAQKFERQREKYVALVRDMAELRKDTELATFLPAWEIYYGDGQDTGEPVTCYLWDPSPPRETFEAVCRQIHENPGADAASQLYRLLHAVYTLTQCVALLHGAGYVHRDLKPSNFGFCKRGGETLDQTVVLFDTDTLTRIGSAAGAVGSPGYADESHPGAADIRSDIYSIGAILFRALAGDSRMQEEGALYRSEYYDRIPHLVSESELLGNLDTMTASTVADAVSLVLTRSLCARDRRYTCAEELQEDLSYALSQIAPIAVAANLNGAPEDAWEVRRVDPYAEAGEAMRTIRTIGTALWRYPIFEHVQDASSPVQVLVCGLDVYGRRYLDMALQMAQLLDNPLEVLVLAEHPAQVRAYLADRPGLAEFFTVDGEEPEGGESYGSISFAASVLPQEDRKAWEEQIRKACSDAGEFRPAAAFCSLGSDERSLAAARAVLECAVEAGRPCSVTFLRKDPDSVVVRSESIHAADLTESEEDRAAYADLERMAFNVQLLWEPSGSTDMEAIRRRFLDPYNYYSNVSSAAGTKYNLRSLGIEASGAQAAEQYADTALADTEDAARLRDILSWKEHKRWVAEKVCEGWTSVADLEQCMQDPYTARVPGEKKHACIVRSRPERVLTTDAGRWDGSAPEDMEALDPLDTVSAGLHAMLGEHLRQRPRGTVTSGRTAAALGSLALRYPQTRQAYHEWHAAMAAISSGDMKRSAAYGRLLGALTEAVQEIPDSAVRNSILRLADALDTRFRAELAYAKCTDYKAVDEGIIRGLPFILCRFPDTALVVPFRMGSSSALFGNVAAATVLQPQQILYPVLLQNEADAAEFRTAVDGVHAYAARHGLLGGVRFLVLYDPDTVQADEKEISDHLTEVWPEADLEFLRTDSAEEMEEAVRQAARQLCEHCELAAAERNDAPLSYLLAGSGFYRDVPSYAFDSKSEHFRDLSGCEQLRYAARRTSMDVEDMMALQCSFGSRSADWDFSSIYEQLWRLYTDGRGTWKELCHLLDEKAREEDEIAAFSTRAMDREAMLRYYLPPICHDEAVQLAERLQSYGMIHKVSFDYTSHADRFGLILEGCVGSWEDYDRVFGDPTLFLGLEKVRCIPDARRDMVHVCVDRLSVEDVELADLEIPGAEQRMQRFVDLLEALAKLGCVRYTYTDSTVSVAFPSAACKRLLTTAGMVLELYTYYEAKKSGQFDDIVCGYEVAWGGTGAKSEFDCILTKGFRSLFVECKARPELSQDFYFRLTSLCELFGVNATAVLVADMGREQDEISREVNDWQRTRGSMLKIVTVSDPEEIRNIGRTLAAILDGSRKG